MKRKYATLFWLLSSVFVFTLVGNAQTEDKNEKKPKDSALKIKSKIKPNENVLVGCNTLRKRGGVYVGVNVTFDKSGKVTDAVIAPGGSSGCEEFDEECVRVAKKIKFKPQISNGEPVTVIKTMSYLINVSFTR
jgi:TonB family protein